MPARRSDIQSALTRYLGQLDAVEAEIRGILADLPTRRIATFHDAFGYFADALTGAIEREPLFPLVRVVTTAAASSNSTGPIGGPR